MRLGSRGTGQRIYVITNPAWPDYVEVGASCESPTMHWPPRGAARVRLGPSESVTAKSTLEPFFCPWNRFGLWLVGLRGRQIDSVSRILILAGGIVWGKSHRSEACKLTADSDSHSSKEAPMNGCSVLASLLRPRTNDGETASKQQVLLPRTAADELPPYREQPWIVDRRGYRKVDSMTLVPADRF